jgi:pimeloyl-ACP methyl ester carboxylesterase
MAAPRPFTAVVHTYAAPTGNFHAYEIGPIPSRNAIVFIGGLGDGPHHLSYVQTLAKRLETSSTALQYSIFEIRIRSSYTGWGTSSLSNDVGDISALVKYLRDIGKEKIVLFGHSTGCQVELVPLQLFAKLP